MKGQLLLVLWAAAAWGYPSSLSAPSPCVESECDIEDNCRCATTDNPIQDENDPAPQLLAITVSESIVTTLYHDYLNPLFFDRLNPDGNPMTMTYFVNHEYTDYELVQQLYLQGYEIGVHSITKNSSQEYWREATLEDLIEEFDGQRQIISKFANIPIEDIVGARTPQLQLEGDVSINAYIQSGITYDNSWPTESQRLFLPYTLNYKSPQSCGVTMTCPQESHPGFWVSPLTDIKGQDGVECNSLATCLVDGTPDEIASWLLGEVNRVRENNRGPLVLRLDSYWFQFIGNSYDGFVKFLDQVESMSDVFLVSVEEIMDWIKNPVPVSQFRTVTHNRQATCSPVTCDLLNVDGQDRYMRSCVPCPQVYPWKGNPNGDII